MNVYLWIAIILLVIALIVAIYNAVKPKTDEIGARYPVVEIPEDMVVFDEASDVTPEMFRKPKQMKSRPRNKS